MVGVYAADDDLHTVVASAARCLERRPQVPAPIAI
jgi:hypothetical protein